MEIDMEDCKMEDCKKENDTQSESEPGIDFDELKIKFSKLFSSSQSEFLDSTDGRTLVKHIQDELRKEHPYEYRESVESMQFKKIMASIQDECKALEVDIEERREVIRKLEEELTSVEDKLEDLTPVEATITWLYGVMFDVAGKAQAIRDVLPNTGEVYGNLMLRYQRLKDSKQLVNSGGVFKIRGTGVRSRPFVCSTCRTGFDHAKDFERHLDSVCEYRGNDAYQAEYMVKKRERDCTCIRCGFVAKTPSGRKNHEKTHMGRVEKAYRRGQKK
jgi:hypothetical protein